MAHRGKTDHATEKASYKKKFELMDLELDIYREIGGLVVKGSSREEILARTLEFASRALDTETAALFTVDGDTGGLTVEIALGRGAEGMEGVRLEPGTGIAGLSARTVTARLGNCPDPSWPLDGDGGSTMIASPLLLHGRPIAVLGLINGNPNPYTTDDLEVLKRLTEQFSVIIERGELFGELDDRIKQFSTLHEVGSLLISTLEHDVVRHRAMEAITKLMRAEAGSLLLVDEDAGELYFEVALGEKGDHLKEVRLKIGEGIAGWVAENGEPLIINDVARDPRFQARVDRKSEFTTKNMICVPVKIKGRTIGVLQAINRLGAGEFTEPDLRVFQLFSNQVAIALDNARLYEEIKDTFHATSAALAEAIEKRDPYTGGHTKRVLAYCLAIASRLGLGPEEMETLRLSAVLHDIGKIGVEDRVLRKEAPLDESEAGAMKLHPIVGAEIMKHVPRLKDVVPGMLYHHERFDGLGYPDGLKGEEIPLIARIISVADTFDAMTTTRPYRKGLPVKVAFDELKRFSGIQFDGTVVDAFLDAFEAGEITNLAAEDSDDDADDPFDGRTRASG